MKNILSDIVAALLLLVLLPATLYLFPCGGAFEQQWLDKAIDHLRNMHAECDDPDLAGIIDYTVARYNRIGRFDVSVQYTVGLNPMTRALAYNAPWMPGLTLDHDLLAYPIEFGAVVLVHEALHDYPPYIGHGHINQREERLHELSRRVSR